MTISQLGMTVLLDVESDQLDSIANAARNLDARMQELSATRQAPGGVHFVAFGVIPANETGADSRLLIELNIDEPANQTIENLWNSCPAEISNVLAGCKLQSVPSSGHEFAQLIADKDVGAGTYFVALPGLGVANINRARELYEECVEVASLPEHRDCSPRELCDVLTEAQGVTEVLEPLPSTWPEEPLRKLWSILSKVTCVLGAILLLHGAGLGLPMEGEPSPILFVALAWFILASLLLSIMSLANQSAEESVSSPPEDRQSQQRNRIAALSVLAFLQYIAASSLAFSDRPLEFGTLWLLFCLLILILLMEIVGVRRHRVTEPDASDNYQNWKGVVCFALTMAVINYLALFTTWIPSLLVFFGALFVLVVITIVRIHAIHHTAELHEYLQIISESFLILVVVYLFVLLFPFSSDGFWGELLVGARLGIASLTSVIGALIALMIVFLMLRPGLSNSGLNALALLPALLLASPMAFISLFAYTSTFTIVFLILLALLVRGLCELQSKEEQDEEQLPLWPDRNRVRTEVLAREAANLRSQNHLFSVVPIKSGEFRLGSLKAVLGLVGLLNRLDGTRGELSGIVTIHFARWVVLSDGRLLFLSNFMGTWDSYLDEFIDQASGGLTAIWAHSAGFPRSRFLSYGGAELEQRFKLYARNSHLPTLVHYRAYPEVSVDQIESYVQLNRILQNSARTDADCEAVARILWKQSLDNNPVGAES